MRKGRICFKVLSFLSIFIFTGVFIASDFLRLRETMAAELGLPEPGVLLKSAGYADNVRITGLKLNPDEPFRLQFILNMEDTTAEDRKELMKQVDYFLAALTTPRENLWVNLSPYEADRIIDKSLESTDLGQVLMSQDYILKQLASSLTHPDTSVGRAYWDEIAILQDYEITDRKDKDVITQLRNHLVTNADLSKIWIKPDAASVYERGDGLLALITEATLKVETEADKGLGSLLDSVSDEVNNGAHFAQLRQIYNAVILAEWFKSKFSNTFFKDFFDKGLVEGVSADDKNIKEKVFALYCKAFEKGSYDIIRKENRQKRRYFSGGAELGVDNLNITRELSDVEKANSSVEAVLDVGIVPGASSAVGYEDKHTDAASAAMMSDVRALGIALENFLSGSDKMKDSEYDAVVLTRAARVLSMEDNFLFTLFFDQRPKIVYNFLKFQSISQSHDNIFLSFREKLNKFAIAKPSAMQGLLSNKFFSKEERAALAGLLDDAGLAKVLVSGEAHKLARMLSTQYALKVNYFTENELNSAATDLEGLEKLIADEDSGVLFVCYPEEFKHTEKNDIFSFFSRFPVFPEKNYIGYEETVDVANGDTALNISVSIAELKSMLAARRGRSRKTKLSSALVKLDRDVIADPFDTYPLEKLNALSVKDDQELLYAYAQEGLLRQFHDKFNLSAVVQVNSTNRIALEHSVYAKLLESFFISEGLSDVLVEQIKDFFSALERLLASGTDTLTNTAKNQEYLIAFAQQPLDAVTRIISEAEQDDLWVFASYGNDFIERVAKIAYTANGRWANSTDIKLKLKSIIKRVYELLYQTYKSNTTEFLTRLNAALRSGKPYYIVAAFEALSDEQLADCLSVPAATLMKEIDSLYMNKRIRKELGAQRKRIIDVGLSDKGVSSEYKITADDVSMVSDLIAQNQNGVLYLKDLSADAVLQLDEALYDLWGSGAGTPGVSGTVGLSRATSISSLNSLRMRLPYTQIENRLADVLSRKLASDPMFKALNEDLQNKLQGYIYAAVKILIDHVVRNDASRAFFTINETGKPTEPFLVAFENRQSSDSEELTSTFSVEIFLPGTHRMVAEVKAELNFDIYKIQKNISISSSMEEMVEVDVNVSADADLSSALVEVDPRLLAIVDSGDRDDAQAVMKELDGITTEMLSSAVVLDCRRELQKLFSVMYNAVTKDRNYGWTEAVQNLMLQQLAILFNDAVDFKDRKAFIYYNKDVLFNLALYLTGINTPATVKYRETFSREINQMAEENREKFIALFQDIEAVRAAHLAGMLNDENLLHVLRDKKSGFSAEKFSDQAAALSGNVNIIDLAAILAANDNDKNAAVEYLKKIIDSENKGAVILRNIKSMFDLRDNNNIIYAKFYLNLPDIESDSCVLSVSELKEKMQNLFAASSSLDSSKVEQLITDALAEDTKAEGIAEYVFGSAVPVLAEKIFEAWEQRETHQEFKGSLDEYTLAGINYTISILPEKIEVTLVSGSHAAILRDQKTKITIANAKGLETDNFRRDGKTGFVFDLRLDDIIDATAASSLKLEAARLTGGLNRPGIMKDTNGSVLFDKDTMAFIYLLREAADNMRLGEILSDPVSLKYMARIFYLYKTNNIRLEALDKDFFSNIGKEIALYLSDEFNEQGDPLAALSVLITPFEESAGEYDVNNGFKVRDAGLILDFNAMIEKLTSGILFILLHEAVAKNYGPALYKTLSFLASAQPGNIDFQLNDESPDSLLENVKRENITVSINDGRVIISDGTEYISPVFSEIKRLTFGVNRPYLNVYYGIIKFDRNTMAFIKLLSENINSEGQQDFLRYPEVLRYAARVFYLHKKNAVFYADESDYDFIENLGKSAGRYFLALAEENLDSADAFESLVMPFMGSGSGTSYGGASDELLSGFRLMLDSFPDEVLFRLISKAIEVRPLRTDTVLSFLESVQPRSISFVPDADVKAWMEDPDKLIEDIMDTGSSLFILMTEEKKSIEISLKNVQGIDEQSITLPVVFSKKEILRQLGYISSSALVSLDKESVQNAVSDALAADRLGSYLFRDAAAELAEKIIAAWSAQIPETKGDMNAAMNGFGYTIRISEKTIMINLSMRENEVIQRWAPGNDNKENKGPYSVSIELNADELVSGNKNNSAGSSLSQPLRGGVDMSGVSVSGGSSSSVFDSVEIGDPAVFFAGGLSADFIAFSLVDDPGTVLNN